MDLVVQFIVAVFATIAFAVLFSVPKKELAFCGFTGALGWIIYSVFMKFDMEILAYNRTQHKDIMSELNVQFVIADGTIQIN